MYLESLHLRIGLLEDLYNEATYQAGQKPQRTPETLGIGERVTGLEKTNFINHNFRMNLRDSSGNFCCPTMECDRIYKTAADLHAHIRGKLGNGHNILKRIIDRTYCIRCDLHCGRPRDFQRHEKVSHAEAHESRIELFLRCLTQHAPPNPLVDQSRLRAASDTPARGLDAFPSLVSQPKTSPTELRNVLTNARDSQPFTNSHGSQASNLCTTSSLTTKAVEDNQSHFSSNDAVTPDTIFPFEMPPLRGPHTGSLMDFPFNLGIGGVHVEDHRANNASVQRPDFAASAAPLQQTNIDFAEDKNVVVDFGGHHHNDFPFDIFPPDDRTSA